MEILQATGTGLLDIAIAGAFYRGAYALVTLILSVGGIFSAERSKKMALTGYIARSATAG